MVRYSDFRNYAHETREQTAVAKMQDEKHIFGNNILNLLERSRTLSNEKGDVSQIERCCLGRREFIKV